MDLFSPSPSDFEKPSPEDRFEWMLHHSLTHDVKIHWDLLRREPQPDDVVKRLIKRAWRTGYSQGCCESGPWGIYSGDTEPSLEFSWGSSNRGYFDGEAESIEKDEVITAVRRVMAIGKGKNDRWHKKTPVRNGIRYVLQQPPKRWRLPPMSVRHEYQEGASKLRWVSSPPREPKPVEATDEDVIGIRTLMRRAE